MSDKRFHVWTDTRGHQYVEINGNLARTEPGVWSCGPWHWVFMPRWWTRLRWWLESLAQAPEAPPGPNAEVPAQANDDSPGPCTGCYARPCICNELETEAGR